MMPAGSWPAGLHPAAYMATAVTSPTPHYVSRMNYNRHMAGALSRFGGMADTAPAISRVVPRMGGI